MTMEYEVVIGNYFSCINSLKFLVLSNIFQSTKSFGCLAHSKVSSNILEDIIESCLNHEILHLLFWQMKLYKASKELDNLEPLLYAI